MSNPVGVKLAEQEFAKKYGSAQPKAMNSIMAKRLQGGGQQFFDSGDYNMSQNRKPMGAFPPAFQKKPLPKNISESGEYLPEGKTDSKDSRRTSIGSVNKQIFKKPL